MGPNCPPSCQMAPTQVMPHGQKSKSCKLKEDLQAPREAQGLVGMQAPIAEEDEATPPPPPLLSSLILGSPEEVPATGTLSLLQSSQRTCSSSTAITVTPSSKSNEGSSSQEEDPSTSQVPPNPEFLFTELLKNKVSELVH